MMFAPQDGFNSFGIKPDELVKLGYRLAASSGTAFAAMYKAVGTRMRRWRAAMSIRCSGLAAPHAR